MCSSLVPCMKVWVEDWYIMAEVIKVTAWLNYQQETRSHPQTLLTTLVKLGLALIHPSLSLSLSLSLFPLTLPPSLPLSFPSTPLVWSHWAMAHLVWCSGQVCDKFLSFFCYRLPWDNTKRHCKFTLAQCTHSPTQHLYTSFKGKQDRYFSLSLSLSLSTSVLSFLQVGVAVRSEQTSVAYAYLSNGRIH